IPRGGPLLDLACGSGAPGLVVARAAGASLVGVDWSHVALRAAKARATEARFVTGSALALPFRAETFAGPVSIAALALRAPPERQRSGDEVARALEPGARFVFTSWEGVPGRHLDRLAVPFAPLLAAAGFAVEERREDPRWIDRAKVFFAKVLEREEAI